MGGGAAHGPLVSCASMDQTVCGGEGRVRGGRGSLDAGVGSARTSAGGAGGVDRRRAARTEELEKAKVVLPPGAELRGLGAQMGGGERTMRGGRLRYRAGGLGGTPGEEGLAALQERLLQEQAMQAERTRADREQAQVRLAV